MKLSIQRLSFRFRVAVLVAVAALCVRLALPSPPAATLRGVADMLGESVGASVQPGEFVWEPSRGAVIDSILGRRVVFLARTSSEAPRDVYRAHVRVSLEGNPVDVLHAVNLTESPMGDEQALAAYAHHVAYATVAYGAVQQVTVLNLDGHDGLPSDPVGRVMSWLTNVQTTGALAGLGRTEVSTNVPAKAVSMRLDDDTLGVRIDGGRAAFAVSLDSGQVVRAPDGPLSVSSMRVPQLPKPPILWAVDTVRSVTGPEFIAWLEDHVFDVRDRVKRAGYRAFGDGSGATTHVAATATPPPPPPAPKKVGANDFDSSAAWPPQNLRPIWKEPAEREGVWRRPRHRFLQENEVPGANDKAPSYFYQTHVRPDPDRPWSKVWMVAMDSRQIQLGMQGGIDDPKPLTGARGEGRIPREPEVLHRAVGAFNGGFKTTHGEYGMMVARRVLLPPKQGAATVMVTSDGRTGFGTWPDRDAIPPNMLSFRQNLEPLVDGGVLRASERAQWGWHLHTTGMLTHRSGLCLTSTGHMVYAWGPEVTAETLGNAMIQAGCSYAVHLDMNPRHTAFAYVDARKRPRAALLHPGMQVLAKRFIVWSPKDFFYLTLRQFGPPPVPGLTWEADEGTHPPPHWAPAVFRAEDDAEGGTVDVLAFSPKRTEFRLRAGSDGSAAASRLGDDLTGRVLASLVTGTGSNARHALRLDDRTFGQSGGGAAVWLRDGQLHMSDCCSDSKVPEDADWMELPLLACDDRVTALASEKGVRRHRTAIGTTSDGTVWLARGNLASYDPVVDTLRRAGCRVVASFDRGSERPARVYRAGTDEPPVDRYDVPVLYVLGKALRPGAFRWQPE